MGSVFASRQALCPRRMENKQVSLSLPQQALQRIILKGTSVCVCVCVVLCVCVCVYEREREREKKKKRILYFIVARISQVGSVFASKMIFSGEWK